MMDSSHSLPLINVNGQSTIQRRKRNVSQVLHSKLLFVTEWEDHGLRQLRNNLEAVERLLVRIKEFIQNEAPDDESELTLGDDVKGVQGRSSVREVASRFFEASKEFIQILTVKKILLKK